MSWANDLRLPLARLNPSFPKLLQVKTVKWWIDNRTG